MPEVIIITSPYSPSDLYQVMHITDRKIDKLDQLTRRVPRYYEFHHDKIQIFKWNDVTHEYWWLNDDVLPPVEELIAEESEPKEPSLPFYGLEYYKQHPEIDPKTNELKEKDPHSSPKLSEDPMNSNGN